MKRFLLSLCISMGSLVSFAQPSITGFTIIPANPTENDSVKVIIECYFPSTSCFGSAYLNGINDNVIDAGGLHCMGMLAAICTDYDTLVLAPLSPGTYTLNYLLVTGTDPGCIPGIQPVYMDSVSFTVSTASGIPEPAPKAIYELINTNGQISLQLLADIEGLEIIAADGKLVKQYKSQPIGTILDIKLPHGAYVLQFITKSGRVVEKLGVGR